MTLFSHSLQPQGGLRLTAILVAGSPPHCPEWLLQPLLLFAEWCRFLRDLRHKLQLSGSSWLSFHMYVHFYLSLLTTMEADPSASARIAHHVWQTSVFCHPVFRDLTPSIIPLLSYFPISFYSFPSISIFSVVIFKKAISFLQTFENIAPFIYSSHYLSVMWPLHPFVPWPCSGENE